MNRSLWPLLAVLLVASVLALVVSARPVSLAELWAAFASPDPGNPAHLAIRELRLPRLLAGIVTGGALGIAGALMQAVTRNPLAEPGLMGINAGAGLSVVLGASFGLGHGATALAFPGAALAALAVFLLGGARSGGIGPARLALAGMALNAFLLSAVTALVLTSVTALDDYRFWVIGTLSDAANRPYGLMAVVAGLAMVAALVMAPVLDTMALGDEAARALGLRLGMVRVGVLVLVATLAGAAVILAGPLVFVGLMAPHLARMVTGTAMRARIAASGLIGACVVLLCDVAGRMLLPPGEIRVGTMAGLAGGVVFVLVARRVRLGALT